MSHPAVPITEPVPEPPVQHVVGRLMPDTRDTCYCGNVTPRAHNGFTCSEVLQIRARVDGVARERLRWWR